MELAIAILLVIGLAAFTMTPLLARETISEGALPVDVTPLADLKRRRLAVYESLKDLEFEHRAGNISQEDYQSLRENHMAEASQLLLASQEKEANDRGSLIEKQVAARRAQKKTRHDNPYICLDCGFENPLPVRFCGNCGAELDQQTGKGKR